MKELFSMPQGMVFKGGTSLSKGYQLIDRFSEDLDITIDYRNFYNPIDFTMTSKSQLKKISDILKADLKNLVSKKIFPHLSEQIKNLGNRKKFELQLSDDGEQLCLYYPSILENNNDYLRDHVLVEFGMRNSTEPFDKVIIKPYLDILEEDLDLPLPAVNILSPTRTFWEKATLIHVECCRGRLTSSVNRISRHWYDLYLLSESSVGNKAKQNIALLESVIVFKKAFFNASYAHYDDCLRGFLKLIPDKFSCQQLESDYKKMIQAGMFYKEPRPFSLIMSTLKTVQNTLNHAITQY